MHIKLIAVFFPFLFLTNRENIKKEIIALNKKYYAAPSFNIDVTTRAYEVSSAKLLKSTRVTMVQTPGHYFTGDGITESMANNKYKVSIHHTKKLIAVSKLASKSPDMTEANLSVITGMDFTKGLDTILDLYKDIKLQSLDGGNNELTFLFKSGKFRLVKLIYDKASYQVSEIEILTAIREKEYRYIINYSYHKPESISRKIFDEANYFSIKAGKLIVHQKFSDYKLIYNK